MSNIRDLESAISTLDGELISLADATIEEAGSYFRDVRGALGSVESEFNYVESDFEELTAELDDYRGLGFADAGELKIKLESAECERLDTMEQMVIDFRVANCALRKTNFIHEAAPDEINTITDDALTGGDAIDFIGHPDGTVQDVRNGQ